MLKSLREKIRGKSSIFSEANRQGFESPENYDLLISQARQLYYESSSFSISLLQERFDIGYITAAEVMEQLEVEGLFDNEIDAEMEWETIE